MKGEAHPSLIHDRQKAALQWVSQEIGRVVEEGQLMHVPSHYHVADATGDFEDALLAWDDPEDDEGAYIVKSQGERLVEAWKEARELYMEGGEDG